MRRILPGFLVLSFFLLFLNSCVKDDFDTNDNRVDNNLKNNIEISERYFPLENYKHSIQSADIKEGIYTICFTDQKAPIISGSVLQLDLDSMVKLVRVLSVDSVDNNIQIKTEPADIGDIFVSGSFTLSTERNNSTKERTSTLKNIFYPSTITYYDENNQKHTVNLDYDMRGGFEKRLFHKEIDFSDFLLGLGNIHISLDTCIYIFDLDFIMSYNFEEKKDGIKKFRQGELVLQKSAIRGNLETDFLINHQGYSETRGEIENVCIKPNIHKPISAKFLVGNIPLYVTMNTDLFLEADYRFNGKVSAYTGFSTSTEMELGFSWEQGIGLTPYSSFDYISKWKKPKIKGTTHMDSKLSLYPRINFSLYGLIGPSFDIKPYIKNNLDISCQGILTDYTDNIPSATFNLFTGYDASVALTLFSIINKESIIKSPSWNVWEKLLYKGPSKLEYSGERYDEVEIDQTYKIDFSVKDYNILTNSFTNSILPWPVKFQTNCGILNYSADTLWAPVNIQTGLASTYWTPSKTNDGNDPYVLAIIYNHEGKEILAERFTTKLRSDSILCPDENHPHMIDLGLPSGTKWSCCNIGANTPYEIGNYYAYGETEIKDIYSWGTYKWCNGSENSLIKYCTDEKRGIVDNKNTLDTSDDVARVKWGNGWTMHSSDDFQEINVLCNWRRTIYKGTIGHIVTGLNGNKIFFPAGGFKRNDYIEFLENANGFYYRMSTLFGPSYYSRKGIKANSQNKGFWQWEPAEDTRAYGFPVRPIKK